ncbi:MAG TPA: hypothetical protein VHW65_10635 [Gemmatimonadales bacterium]|nr:hypothetical protein [Gemmatimonadales bacterium]
MVPYPSRSTVRCAGLLALAACGGKSALSTPTDTTPAAIHVLAGDGQTAAAGSALPIHPSVMVVNAEGHGVAGVTVTFAVDSGGGGIAGGSTTTGSDGSVTAGAWTLGTANVVNALSVTVANIAILRLHATVLSAIAETLISNKPIGPGGGTLTFQHPGDPLDGLSITVPPASYATSGTWNVVTDPNIRPVLPTGFSQIGPALVIGNGQGYADSTMTLTEPMVTSLDDAVAPFYYDAASGSLELIPIVGRTATSATLTTRHFSGSLTASALRSSGAIRSARMGEFGNAVVIWVSVPMTSLYGTFTTGYLLGVDNWEFINNGDYFGPHGNCFGMSATSMYYYYLYRTGTATQPGLYHRYDQSLVNQWDNVQGVRFSGSVQHDYETIATATGAARLQLIIQAKAAGQNIALVEAQSLLLSLKLTGQPVGVALANTTEGHAVVAYAATASASGITVSIADPNFPTTARALQFTSTGTLTPFNASTSAGAAQTTFTIVVIDGVTAELPLNSMATRWQQFMAHNAGGADTPTGYSFQFYNVLEAKWLPLPDSLHLTYPPQMGLKCPSCKPLTDGSTNEPGELWLADGSAPAPGLFLSTPAIRYMVLGQAIPPWDGSVGFVDTASVVITYTQMRLSTGDSAEIGDTVTVTVHAPGLVTPGSTLSWEFRDSTATLVTADTLAKHAFAHSGTFKVLVSLRDAQGTLVGRDSADLAVHPPPHWVWWLTSATQTASSPPPVLTAKSDSVEQDSVTSWLNDLHTHPENWLIFATDSAGCQGVILEQFPDGAIVGGALVQKAGRTVLGITSRCVQAGAPDTGALTIGPIDTGKVVGNLTPQNLGNSIGFLGGSIDGQMALESETTAGQVTEESVMTGTFTWILSFSSGYVTYTITFAGKRI